MIGQKNLIASIDDMLAQDTLPHFIILTGSIGSGRKTLARYIGDAIGNVAEIDVSVDAVRNMIDNSYKIVNKSVFIIPDADNMSVQAKNALLKVTEEPPNDAYFIMTLEDQYNTLQTIRSRGTVYTMENYSREELMQYLVGYTDIDKNSYNDVIKIAQTPGEILELSNYDVKEFYDFVELVVNNIAESQLGNTFKIADRIAVAKDSDGYDLKLFFKAFITICLQLITVDAQKYATGASITSEALRSLNITGVSKQMVIDTWILEMRKAWT